uniref:Uncharacterized protein n=1 Tax=Trichogramma kaykai TaxID=54128 RepID=A0ABD2X1Z9_9HYME
MFARARGAQLYCETQPILCMCVSFDHYPSLGARETHRILHSRTRGPSRELITNHTFPRATIYYFPHNLVTHNAFAAAIDFDISVRGSHLAAIMRLIIALATHFIYYTISVSCPGRGAPRSNDERELLLPPRIDRIIMMSMRELNYYAECDRRARRSRCSRWHV